MAMTRADMNSYVQTYAGAQLRTFSKTHTITVVAHRQHSNTTIIPSRLDVPPGSSTTTSAGYSQNFNYTSAANSLYNNYVDAGINSGQLIYAQDIVDTIEDLVRRTVDVIEGQIGNRSISALFCHGSCHTSCHTSRGRR